MKEYCLYQTLENRENADEVENRGPFLCERSDAWLTEGYYFWETFIKNAHEWGKNIYNGNYFICCSKIDYNKVKLYDLNETQTLTEFGEMAEQIAKKRGKEITVRGVLEFLIKNTTFKYDVIRVTGESFYNTKKLPFIYKKYPNRLSLYPAVQVCIRKKNILGKNNFHIVYPVSYMQDYVI